MSDQPDTTEPLGGVTSGEADYVAVNSAGVSAERHVPKGDEEVGKGEQPDEAGHFDPEQQGDGSDGGDELEQAPQARPASD